MKRALPWLGFGAEVVFENGADHANVMCNKHDGERRGSVDEAEALEPSLPLQEGGS